MWVNVKDQFVFPSRMAVTPLSRVDFVNAGYPPDLGFRLMDIPEFNEDLVRSLLYRTYGNQFTSPILQTHPLAADVYLHNAAVCPLNVITFLDSKSLLIGSSRQGLLLARVRKSRSHETLDRALRRMRKVS